MDFNVNIDFHWSDYFLFIATIVISLAIGVYYAISGDKQKTTREYLMANYKLGAIPVALSMFMSYISAILVLGNTAEMYLHGTQMWLAAFGSSLAFIVSAVFFVPLFYPLKITSSFQYLEMRFKSKAVRLTGTILLMISTVFYMGLAIYSPAIALNAVTRIPVYASIIGTGVVATIYTTIGGMKAVVWTDVFQALVMVAGLISVLVMGVNKIDGGIKQVFITANKRNRIVFFNMDPNPLVRLSFWSVVFGRLISSTQTAGTSQTSVQRYCSVSSLNRGRLSVILNTPAMLLFYSLTCLIGLVVFAYFDNLGCDPLRAGFLKNFKNETTSLLANQNQLLPYFVKHVIAAKGLSGLFVAILFSGALSTLSSSLNSLSAVTWKDLLEWKYYSLSETRKSFITKALVLIYGIIAVCMAFAAQYLGGHVLQASQSFVSGSGGPAFGVFMLGAFFPFTNWIGAMVGSITGIIFTTVITVGQYVTRPYASHLHTNMDNCSDYNLREIKPIPQDNHSINGLFRISFMWTSAIGMIFCVIVGIFVSLITGMEQSTDERLVIPVCKRMFAWLPIKVKEKFNGCWCNCKDKSDEDDKVDSEISKRRYPKNVVEPALEMNMDIKVEKDNDLNN